MNGPYELELGRAPVHHLGNREGRKCLLNHGRNKLLNGLALDMCPAEQPLALVGLQVLCLVNSDSVGLCPALGSLGRLSVLVVGSLQRRSLLLDVLVRLAAFETCNLEREPSRSGVPLDGVKGEISRLQIFLYVCLECSCELREGLGRELLGADFNQKIVL